MVDNFLNHNSGPYINLSSPSGIAKSVLHALFQPALYFYKFGNIFSL